MDEKVLKLALELACQEIVGYENMSGIFESPHYRKEYYVDNFIQDAIRKLNAQCEGEG